MSNLIPFAFDSHALRALVRDGEPWFVATDVCAALGIANGRDAIRRLDNDEKGVGLTDTLGGKQEVNLISESGLYTLILRTREATTPGTTAHRFRKWVTSEVLPSLRRSGSYSIAASIEQTVPATDLMAAQARELELSRKLIEVQEKLLAATGKKPKRKAVRPITSDEIAEMKRLRALGLPVAEIARRTGRSAAAISQLTRDVADTADLFAGAP